MAGHGSAPPPDRANHPGRQVSRLTGGHYDPNQGYIYKRGDVYGTWTGEHPEHPSTSRIESSMHGLSTQGDEGQHYITARARSDQRWDFRVETNRPSRQTGRSGRTVWERTAQGGREGKGFRTPYRAVVAGAHAARRLGG